VTKSHQGRCTTATTGKNDMLEWRRLAANRKVRRMAASIPNTAPVVHFTPSRSRYRFILLGEQRHTGVSNLPRVAHSGGTAGNGTRNLSITNPTSYRLPLHHQATCLLESEYVTTYRFNQSRLASSLPPIGPKCEKPACSVSKISPCVTRKPCYRKETARCRCKFRYAVSRNYRQISDNFA